MGVIVYRQSNSINNDIEVYNNDGTTQRMNEYSSIYLEENVPFDEELVSVEIGFDVYKSNNDEGLVSGWANVAVNADGTLPLDWQDDTITATTLEKAAINFMLEYRGSGVGHQGDPVGTVVESIVFTKEKQACIGIPEGTIPEGWFITVKVWDPAVFAKVKDGTYKMFSIQGKSKRIRL